MITEEVFLKPEKISYFPLILVVSWLFGRSISFVKQANAAKSIRQRADLTVFKQEN